MAINKAIAGLTVLGLLIGAGGMAHAQGVTNGGFEANGGNGQIGVNTYATGWSINNPSYTFLYAPGTADTTGANGQYGNVALWGPLPATSPAGGYFIAQDGDFQQSAITQTINGLTVGQSYTVGFWWAAAQQNNRTGASTEQWQVSLGGQTLNTAVLNDPSQGFSGWQYTTMNFTADNSTDVLSFFANGSPGGVPTFALLDGVSMNATPESASVNLMFGGLMGIGVFAGLARLRKRSVKSAA